MLLFFVGIERAFWVDLLSPGQVILHWPFSLVFFFQQEKVELRHSSLAHVSMATVKKNLKPIAAPAKLERGDEASAQQERCY